MSDQSFSSKQGVLSTDELQTLVPPRYTITEKLGQGGMGQVFAGIDHESGEKKVALKVSSWSHDNASAVERFRREGWVGQLLSNKHSVRTLECAPLKNSKGHYLVLEYLDGMSLEQVLVSKGRLEVETAIEYLLQACEAVAELHSVGIIHRDLSLSNLFLARSEEGEFIKVVDFGIAFFQNEQTRLTGPMGQLGNQFICAPEQHEANAKISASTDIWALGLALYQLLTNQHPFPGVKYSPFVKVASAPNPITFHRPEISDALNEAVLRCLEVDQSARYQTMFALAETLAPFASDAARSHLDEIARYETREKQVETTQESAAQSVREEVLRTPSLRITQRALARAHVLWHPGFVDGEAQAKRLYELLCRVPLQPLSRNLGIPVRFWSQQIQRITERAELDAAEHNIVALLFDETMKQDERWRTEMAVLVERIQKARPKCALVPFHFAAPDKKWVPIVGEAQADRSALMRENDTLFALANALFASSEPPPSPPRLWLCGAGLSWDAFACRFGDYVREKYALSIIGHETERTGLHGPVHRAESLQLELRSQGEQMVMVVYCADGFATHASAIAEPIAAKKRGVPVVVVDALETAENRSHPYLGNLPTIRWKNATTEGQCAIFDTIVRFALRELVRRRYARPLLAQIGEMNKERAPKRILPWPPESLTCAQLADEEGVVLYPDPPLGRAEHQILKELRPKLDFLTPTSFMQEG